MQLGHGESQNGNNERLSRGLRKQQHHDVSMTNSASSYERITKSHTRCHKFRCRTGDDKGWLPTRILDLRDRDGDSEMLIGLVEGKALRLDKDYAALSYYCRSS